MVTHYMICDCDCLPVYTEAYFRRRDSFVFWDVKPCSLVEVYVRYIPKELVRCLIRKNDDTPMIAVSDVFWEASFCFGDEIFLLPALTPIDLHVFRLIFLTTSKHSFYVLLFFLHLIFHHIYRIDMWVKRWKCCLERKVRKKSHLYFEGYCSSLCSCTIAKSKKYVLLLYA